MPELSIRERVQAYFSSVGTMNPTDWSNHFSEDALVYDPVGTPPKLAHRDAQRFFDLLSQFYASLEVTPDRIYLGGDGAAVTWTMRVVTKNGMSGKAEGISVFDVDGTGKIQKLSTYWDEAALLDQLKGGG